MRLPITSARALRSGAFVVVLGLVPCCGTFKAPNELDHDAREFMRVVVRNQLDSAMAYVQLNGDPDTLRQRLHQAHDFMARYKVDSAELVGWNVVVMNDTRGSLTYEAHGDTGWAFFGVDLARSGSSSYITGFRWQPMSARLADVNRFSLKGRSAVHVLYLTLAALSLLGCLGGAMFAGVQRMGVWWVLFCLVGMGKATIDWSTGHQTFNPINIQVLGAGFLRSGTVGPWLVSWSLPLGTLLMFFKWRARQASTAASKASVAA